MFYGREDDFRYVRTKLEGTSQGVVIVFCGERRAGKSSILYQVAGGRLGDRFIPVFIDLQEMVIASDSEFFGRISRVISEAVARANSRQAIEPAAVKGPGGPVDRVALSAAAQEGNEPCSSGATTRIESNFDGRNPYPVFSISDEVLASIGRRTLLIMDEHELLEGVDEASLPMNSFTPRGADGQ
jgi:hypothetical protein